MDMFPTVEASGKCALPQIHLSGGDGKNHVIRLSWLATDRPESTVQKNEIVRVCRRPLCIAGAGGVRAVPYYATAD